MFEVPAGMQATLRSQSVDQALYEVTPYHGQDDRNFVVTDGDRWWYGGSSEYTYATLIDYLLANDLVVKNPAAIYDQLADTYDDSYSDAYCLEENAIVMDMAMRLITPRDFVLDVGCGTGLALEMGITTIHMYEGLDPSEGMLKKFQSKFPKAEHVCSLNSFESFCDSQPDSMRFGAVISLFGSPSYIDPAYIPRMFEISPKVMLMHYVPGYWPDYEGMPLHSDASREVAREECLKRDGTVMRLNNFQVTKVG
jgi:SAM-dependent methyltransferase